MDHVGTDSGSIATAGTFTSPQIGSIGSSTYVFTIAIQSIYQPETVNIRTPARGVPINKYKTREDSNGIVNATVCVPVVAGWTPINTFAGLLNGSFYGIDFTRGYSIADHTAAAGFIGDYTFFRGIYTPGSTFHRVQTAIEQYNESDGSRSFRTGDTASCLFIGSVDLSTLGLPSASYGGGLPKICDSTWSFPVGTLSYDANTSQDLLTLGPLAKAFYDVQAGNPLKPGYNKRSINGGSFTLLDRLGGVAVNMARPADLFLVNTGSVITAPDQGGLPVETVYSSAEQIVYSRFNLRNASNYSFPSMVPWNDGSTSSPISYIADWDFSYIPQSVQIEMAMHIKDFNASPPVVTVQIVFRFRCITDGVVSTVYVVSPAIITLTAIGDYDNTVDPLYPPFSATYTHWFNAIGNFAFDVTPPANAYRFTAYPGMTVIDGVPFLTNPAVVAIVPQNGVLFAFPNGCPFPRILPIEPMDGTERACGIGFYSGNIP